MTEENNNQRDGEPKERTVIYARKKTVPNRFTIRVTDSDNEWYETLFQRCKNSEMWSRAVFMRYIFHLGLEAAEKELT